MNRIDGNDFMDLYLCTITLNKMNEYDRELFTYMYKKMVDYMLEPSDLSDISKRDQAKSSEILCLNHLCRTLIEYGVLKDKRELNIEKIIE